jgi:drug/metabolite transporter (DMT)-like permease
LSEFSRIASDRRLKEVAVNKILGIILIALGIFGLAWGGFTYTTREKIVDIGPIHATREATHNVPLPPIAGALALIGGIVLLVAGRKE